MRLARVKNRAAARLLTRYPRLARPFLRHHTPEAPSGEIPWAPVVKPLQACRVAIVTTAGVHHRDQPPFDMADPKGDPTFRVIEAGRPVGDLMITHDYYDHTDADRDINIVFPMERLRELAGRAIIGEVAETHFAFMGHILDRHLRTLVNETAPDAASRLRAQGTDLVLVTPG